MLQRISTTPPRYYQLALLNIGLISALAKGFSLLYVVSSLAFIALLTAPVAIYFKLLSSDNVQIIHEQLQTKLSQCWLCMKSQAANLADEPGNKQMKFYIVGLLVVYTSLSLLCPCIETFLIINATFIYLFMQEEVESFSKIACNMCEGICPASK